MATVTMSEDHPAAAQRLAAGAVHAYTASGVVLALLMVHFSYAGDVALVLLLFGIAMVVDGTDGFLARRLQVKTRLPGFDGALLDNIVDYITYAFAPIVLLASSGYLPDGVWGWVVAAVPLLASCVQFCRTDAKGNPGDDHHFLGFPSYWNIVAFYLVAAQASPTVSTIVLLFCTVAVFVPIRYVYPSRTRLLWRVTMPLSTAWLVGYFLILTQLPDPHPFWLALSGVYIVYYVAVSLRLTVTATAVTEQPSPVPSAQGR